MAIRAHLGVVPQPLRWLTAWSVAWAALASAALWIRSRSWPARVGVPPLSADWLHDYERQSTRLRDL
ncbi:MAG: hypothetical protein ACRD26_18575 [Vicinamibacterales bacterium]